ncbi:MAG: XdhC/CoxI family protein [Pyrinomonadaceae bacterium]
MENSPPQNPPERLTHALARVLEEGSRAALVTVVEAARGVGAKVLFEASGAGTGTTGDAALDDALAERARAFLAGRDEARTVGVEEFAPALEEWRGARFLFERVEPEPRVVVCGAGHVGAALARLARAVGYRVTLLDDRGDFLTRERFPEQEIELVAAPGWARQLAEVIGTGRGVYVAVVTRGHNEDEECMKAALAARPDYVGMIGSRRRTGIVLSRLRDAGFPEEQLREVRAPVGLDIGAVSPEEVALSTLAEIVAHRRGGTGAPLSAWRRE